MGAAAEEVRMRSARGLAWPLLETLPLAPDPARLEGI